MSEESSKLIKAGSAAEKVKIQVKKDLDRFLSNGIKPRMAVVAASKDAGVLSYINVKQKLAEELDIQLDMVNLSETTTQTELEQTVKSLSQDSQIHGVVLESPLYSELNAYKALENLDPKKDVDGLTTTNLGLVMENREEEAILSATPQAMIILAKTKIDLTGKHVAVVGRGRTVGRPLVPQLLNRGATVTVCHSKTPDLTKALSTADIVMVGIGSSKFVTDKHIAENQIVVDAGINIADDEVYGDVDLESVLDKVSFITPVPGGVGTLTTIIIFRNLVKAMLLQEL